MRRVPSRPRAPASGSAPTASCSMRLARLAISACFEKHTLRAKPRSHCRAPLRLPLPPSHCNATTADRTVTSHCLFNTPHAVAGPVREGDVLVSSGLDDGTAVVWRQATSCSVARKLRGAFAHCMVRLPEKSFSGIARAALPNRDERFDHVPQKTADFGNKQSA